MSRLYRLWLGWVCIGMMALLMVACGDTRHSCPSLPTQGDILAGEIDTTYCCEALTVCCKEVPEGEDKTKCEEDALAGAQASCQARYYSMLSFQYCQPVYVKDYPQWTPKEVER